jgi:uncharacterized OB-fold protein
MTPALARSKPLLPVVPFLRIPDSGDPYLEGLACRACRAVFLDRREVCASCGGRDTLFPQRLSNTGTLYVYTIVCRSFPGIDTPYVSAVVDLDGGGTVKGNLIHVEPDPKGLAMGMPVELVYQIAPRKDQAGNEYLTYYFQPRGAKQP